MILFHGVVLISIFGIAFSVNLQEIWAQGQEPFKVYDNPRYGINFTYPVEWGEVSDDCPQHKDKYCGPGFAIMVNDTTVFSQTPMEGLTSSELFEKIVRSIDLHSIRTLVFELDKPTADANACNCSTLKDFLVWDYTKDRDLGRTFINDNATTIGRNYSAWQTETMSIIEGIETKTIHVYAMNGDVGYRFQYYANEGVTFDRYLEGFKDMLKTVTFYPAEPEKQPSFLNSSDIANLSLSLTELDDSRSLGSDFASNATQNAMDRTMDILSNPNLGIDGEVNELIDSASSNNVAILSHNSYLDSLGYLHVVGEVQNNSISPVRFVKVSATFYDTNSEVVATDFTYTNPSDVSSGQKAPFELILTSASVPISQIDHYNLVGSYQ